MQQLWKIKYFNVYWSAKSSKTYCKLKKITCTYVHIYTRPYNDLISINQIVLPNIHIVDLYCYIDIIYIVPYVCVLHIYCTLRIIVQGEKASQKSPQQSGTVLSLVREMKLSRADGGFYAIHIACIFFYIKTCIQILCNTYINNKKSSLPKRHGFPVAELR